MVTPYEVSTISVRLRSYSCQKRSEVGRERGRNMVTPYAEGLPPCCCLGTLVRRACCSWHDCRCHEMFRQHDCMPWSMSAPCAHRGNSAPETMLRGSSGMTTLLHPDVTCAALQYHYRPGTITGWIAGLLDRHADRRRSATLDCFLLPPHACLGVDTVTTERSCCAARAAQVQHCPPAAPPEAVPLTHYQTRIPLICRAGANQGVHGWLLRHDALRPCKCAASGAQLAGGSKPQTASSRGGCVAPACTLACHPRTEWYFPAEAQPLWDRLMVARTATPAALVTLTPNLGSTSCAPCAHH